MRRAFRRDSWLAKTASVLFSVILAFGMTPVSAFAETPAARGGDSGSTQQVTAATESSATTSEQQTAQDSPATGQSSLGAQVDTTSVAETKAPDTTTANANAPGDLASLQAALASGATEVTLSGDIEISADATLDIPAGVTVKTAGHTFRVSAGALTVTGTGTIANDAASESSDAHNVFAVAEGASLVLGAQSVKTAGYDAILTYGSVTAVGTAIECTATAEQLTSYDTKALVSADGAAASFTMPSGSITMGTASAADCGLYGVGDTGGAKVVLGDEATHGGPTIGANSAAVGGNNLLGSMDLTIYGGTYTSQLAAEGNYQKFNAVLYLPADATVSISGGTFSGTDYAISMPYTKPDVSLSVSGGTFSGSVAAIWAGTEVGSEGANTSDSYNVTAGTFSSDPAAFLAAGVTAAQGADGTYSIAPAILTAALPGAQVGVAYSEKILTAGLASPSFYLSGGESLPEGLSLAGDGTISGTPAKAGTYAFDVVVGGSEGSVGPVQLTLTVSDTIAIATTSLDAALVNNAYTAQLASTTTASGVTWALAEGSVLPEGLSLGADGVISGTPTVKGATTFTVVATSSTGISASQELTLKVKDKYRQATGTVYLTISTDGGEWWVSDGEISGKTIAYVPIDLAEVSQFDLDEHGLGQFNYAARGDDGSPAENDDYVYECTMMQLFGYFAEHYYSGGFDASVFTQTPGSSFLVGYLGHDSNLNYYLNGAYPIDREMSVGSPWMVGATSDHIALHDGDYVDMSMFQSETESGWKYGATFLYFTTTDDVQTPIHDAGTKAAGESFTVKVRTPNVNMWDPSAQQTYSNFTEAKVEYGTTPGEALGEFPLDDEAVATISIDVPGTYYLWAKDTNDEGQYQALPAYATVTVTGDPCKPVITTTDLGYCTQGGSPSTKVQAVGSPNELTYLVQQDTLPDGLTMDKHGVISGTANEAGVFNVKVAVLNSAGITMAQIPLVVFGPLEFATQQSDIPDAVVGQPYSFQVEVKGDPQSAAAVSNSYQQSNGLVYTNATVSGTPTSAGTFTFRAVARYRLSDGTSVGAVRQSYTVNIVDTPAITTGEIPVQHWTQSAVDIPLEGTGGDLTWSITAGQLPDSVSLDAKTGHLTAPRGILQIGTYNFTVTASNAAGSASKDYTLTVLDNPYISTDSSLPVAFTGEAYSTQIETQIWDDAIADEAANGHTYSLVSGSLPAGLSLAEDGTISGTPEAGAAGDYSFTVKYKAGSWSASKDFTLTVAEPLSITTESLPDAFRGQAYSQQLTAAGYGSDNVTWSKAGGSSWIKVSKDGVVSGTPTYASNNFYVNVKATDASGKSVQKRLTLRSVNKYRQLSGTVYVSVSKDGKFVTSDGANAGTVMNYVPVNLSKVDDIDLDAYGLGDFKLANQGGGTNYAYETTELQLMLYVLDTYCSGGIADGFAGSNSSGYLWVTKFWGIENPYLTYALNGSAALDASNNMLSADKTPIAADDDIAINMLTGSGIYGDANAADHYFVDDKGAIQHSAGALTGASQQFTLQKVVFGMNPDYSTNVQKSAEASYTVSYGTEYGTATGTATTDGNGSVQIAFPSAGTWYVWADGIKGASTDSIVSNPACVTVTVTDPVAPTVATTELGNIRLGEQASVSLAATGNPDRFTWTLAEGSTLPDGLTLNEDGTITGTPTALGTTTFSVTATNEVGTSAPVALTLTVVPKYKAVTGTVYFTYSDDGLFVLADGKISGVYIANLPIDLAEVSKIDLDNYGLGRFNYDADGDGSYEITMMHLFVYAAENYYSEGISNANISGYPHSSYLASYWGRDENLNYYYNYAYPLDSTLGSAMGATSDALPISDGDHVDMAHWSDWSAPFQGYSPFDWFVSTDAETLDANAVTHEYTVKAGEPLTVRLAHAVPNWMAYTTSYDVSAGVSIHTGDAYNTDNAFDGALVTDDKGEAQVTFDVPGTYYVWADGYNTEATDSPTSSAALATVTVTGVPTITTTALPDATFNAPYTAQLEAKATPADLTWYVSDEGALPKGLTLDTATGTISGTPTESGDFAIQVVAVNSEGASQAATVTLSVKAEAPAITTSSLPKAAQDAAYSATIEATGVPSPQLSLAGTLPEGLAFDAATGTISGTPTECGAFPLTVTAANGVDPAATAEFTLEVTAAPAITTTALPTAIVGSEYAQTIETTGYPEPTVYCSTPDVVPGLSIASDGTVSGTPTQAGAYTYQVIASNPGGTTAVTEVTLTVIDTPADGTYSISFTTDYGMAGLENPAALVIRDGQAYLVVTSNTSADGKGAPRFDALWMGHRADAPDASTGDVIHGVPVYDTTGTSGNTWTDETGQVVDKYSFTIPLTSLDQLSAPMPFVIRYTGHYMSTTGSTRYRGQWSGTKDHFINPDLSSLTRVSDEKLLPGEAVPSITTTELPTAYSGEAYSAAIATTGTPAPQLTLTGDLPAGLSFDAATGTISGTPTETGTYQLTVTATSNLGSDARELTLTVANVPAPAFVNGGAYGLEKIEGTEISEELPLSGGKAAELSYDKSAFEGSGITAELSVDGDKVVISGTASEAGTYTADLTVSNAGGSATLKLTVVIDSKQVAITTESLPDATVGEAYSAKVETSGWSLPMLMVIKGSLPAGLSFVDNGDGTATISGTPTEAGSSTFTVWASNAVSTDAMKALTLTVSEPVDAPAFVNGGSFDLKVKEGQEIKGRSLHLKGGAATQLTYDESALEGSGVKLALSEDGTRVAMTGTAGAVGTYTAPVTVSNAGGSATLTLTVTVGSAQTTVTTESLPAATVGQPYSATIATSGSPVAKVILVKGSTLPDGLAYADNGDGTATISGTPTKAGEFELTIHPMNNVSSAVNRALTITVSEPAADRVERLSGALSDDTAAAIANRAFSGEKSDYVVISRDDTYYDALSGAGLAGALNAPILLTGTSELSDSCRAAVQSLGATHAVILGGESAVSAQVASELQAMGLSVERVAGDDVYGTSMACTDYLLAHGGSTQYAIACSPASFVDAVSISGWAYANKVPVMLQTWGSSAAERGFDSAAAQVISGRDLIVCGGAGAVSDESVSGLGAKSVIRLGGDTLYDTNMAIVEFELAHGMSASDVTVASDIYSFSGVDALAASALAGRRGGVVLLAQSNPAYEPEVETDSALGFITAHKDEIESVHVLGGEVAQTPGFYAQIEAALGE